MIRGHMGSLYHACCDELVDISMLEAMHRLMALALDKLGAIGEFSEQAMSSWTHAIMGTALDILNAHRGVSAVLGAKTNGYGGLES